MHPQSSQTMHTVHVHSTRSHGTSVHALHQQQSSILSPSPPIVQFDGRSSSHLHSVPPSNLFHSTSCITRPEASATDGLEPGGAGTSTGRSNRIAAMQPQQLNPITTVSDSSQPMDLGLAITAPLLPSLLPLRRSPTMNDLRATKSVSSEDESVDLHSPSPAPPPPWRINSVDIPQPHGKDMPSTVTQRLPTCGLLEWCVDLDHLTAAPRLISPNFVSHGQLFALVLQLQTRTMVSLDLVILSPPAPSAVNEKVHPPVVPPAVNANAGNASYINSASVAQGYMSLRPQARMTIVHPSGDATKNIVFNSYQTDSSGRPYQTTLPHMIGPMRYKNNSYNSIHVELPNISKLTEYGDESGCILIRAEVLEISSYEWLLDNLHLTNTNHTVRYLSQSHSQPQPQQHALHHSMRSLNSMTPAPPSSLARRSSPPSHVAFGSTIQRPAPPPAPIEVLDVTVSSSHLMFQSYEFVGMMSVEVVRQRFSETVMTFSLALHPRHFYRLKEGDLSLHIEATVTCFHQPRASSIILSHFYRVDSSQWTHPFGLDFSVQQKNEQRAGLVLSPRYAMQHVTQLSSSTCPRVQVDFHSLGMVWRVSRMVAFALNGKPERKISNMFRMRDLAWNLIVDQQDPSALSLYLALDKTSSGVFCYGVRLHAVFDLTILHPHFPERKFVRRFDDAIFTLQQPAWGCSNFISHQLLDADGLFDSNANLQIQVQIHQTEIIRPQELAVGTRIGPLDIPSTQSGYVDSSSSFHPLSVSPVQLTPSSPMLEKQSQSSNSGSSNSSTSPQQQQQHQHNRSSAHHSNIHHRTSSGFSTSSNNSSSPPFTCCSSSISSPHLASPPLTPMSDYLGNLGTDLDEHDDIYPLNVQRRRFGSHTTDRESQSHASNLRDTDASEAMNTDGRSNVAFLQSTADHRSSRMVRQCLSYDTNVLLVTGEYKPAIQLEPSDHLLGTDNQIRGITNLYEGESESLIRITHVDGTSYTVTPNHLVTLMCNRSWSVAVSRTVKANHALSQVRIRVPIIRDGVLVLSDVHSRSYVPIGVNHADLCVQRVKKLYDTKEAAETDAEKYKNEIDGNGPYWREEKGHWLVQTSTRSPQSACCTTFTVRKQDSHDEPLGNMTDDQLREYGEMWYADWIMKQTIHDPSSGAIPVEGAVLERGTIFEMRAEKLLDTSTLITQRLIVGRRESSHTPAATAADDAMVDSEPTIVLHDWSQATRIGTATMEYATSCIKSAKAMNHSVMPHMFHQLSDGGTSYKQATRDTLSTCLVVLHQPLAPSPSLDASGKKALTFINIERVQAELLLPQSVRIVFTELNPTCGQTGTVNSSSDDYDSICAESIASILVSKKPAVVCGVHNFYRFRSADSLIPGVRIQPGTIASIPVTRLTFPDGTGEASITVFHSPHPCITQRLDEFKRALYLACGGDVSQVDQYVPLQVLPDSVPNSIQISKVERVKGGTIVSIEVDGDRRYQIEGRTLTHNSSRTQITEETVAASSTPNLHSLTSTTRHGYVAIIRNSQFTDPKLPQLIAYEVDEDRLIGTFLHALHCDVEIHLNAPGNEMIRIFRSLSQKDYSTYDYLVVMILTHGVDSNIVYAADGQHIGINEIFCMFRGDECKTLTGKPKLFFVQACRGNCVDYSAREGSFIPNLAQQQSNHQTNNNTTSTTTSPNPSSSSTSPKDTQHIIVNRSPQCGSLPLGHLDQPNESDFLYASSCVPGYISWTNTSSGSWYISALCSVLLTHFPTMHLGDILLRVNHAVSKQTKWVERYGKVFQVPSPAFTLTRKMYFLASAAQSSSVICQSNNRLPTAIEALQQSSLTEPARFKDREDDEEESEDEEELDRSCDQIGESHTIRM